MNQILWLIDNHGVSLVNGDDQVVACYSEECESLPLIPRQQELTPQSVGPTDGDTILTAILDVPVFSPESVRLYHNKLIQVQGPTRDYSLTGPGFTQIIWQPQGGGLGTAQDLEPTDELVAHFLQDADTSIGLTGPTGPTGAVVGVLDDLTDVEAAGTFAPMDGDVLGYDAMSGFWVPAQGGFGQTGPTGTGNTGNTGATGPQGPPGSGGGGATSGMWNQESFQSDLIVDTDTILSTDLMEDPNSDEEVLLFLNGVLQRQGLTADYVLGGTDGRSIIWLADTGTAANVSAVDVFIVFYRAA
jgi:hypothetical protein